jgi:hypothetical protein
VEEDFDFDYQTLKDKIVSRFYSRLSDIGQRFNKTIFIIGGASDTIWLDKFSQEYPNTKIACQSLTNLIVNQTHRVDNPVLSFYHSRTTDLVSKFNKLYINKDFGLVLDDIDQGSNRFNAFNANREFFWPDGRHPNRKGHKILFDFLSKESVV